MSALANASEALESLRVRTGSLGVALVARDGRPIAHALPGAIDAESLGVLGALFAGAATTAAQSLQRRGPILSVAVGDEFGLYVAGTLSGALLVVLTGGPDTRADLKGEVLRAAADW